MDWHLLKDPSFWVLSVGSAYSFTFMINFYYFLYLVDEAPDYIFRTLAFLLILLVFYYLSRLARRGVAAACERSSSLR